MLRTLLFVHRYLAVAVGLLMALWCLSGFVMLYQQYPDVHARPSDCRALEPTASGGCCQYGFLPADDDAEPAASSIEMQRGRAGAAPGRQQPVDLGSGMPLHEPQPRRHAGSRTRVMRPGTARRANPLAARGRHRPMDAADGRTPTSASPTWHCDDAAGTELYLNARHRRDCCQDTTAVSGCSRGWAPFRTGSIRLALRRNATPVVAASSSGRPSSAPS